MPLCILWGILISSRPSRRCWPSRGQPDCIQADGGRGMAVLDATTFIVPAHDAADTTIACDAHIADGDILHNATIEYITKEAQIAVSLEITSALVDTDAADGMALTVEGADERAAAVIKVTTYRRIIVLGAGGIVPGDGMSVRYVVSQHEVLFLEDISTVHACASRSSPAVVVMV